MMKTILLYFIFYLTSVCKIEHPKFWTAFFKKDVLKKVFTSLLHADTKILIMGTPSTKELGYLPNNIT